MPGEIMSAPARPRPAPGPDTEVLSGPDLAGPAARQWTQALRPLAAARPGSLSLNRGWNPDWEQERVHAASAAGRPHLSVRLFGGEVLIGPYWVPGAEGGCAGCAELRSRVVAGHPLAADPLRPVSRPAMRRPFLLEMLTPILRNLDEFPLEAGELYALGGPSSRRHLVRRSARCRVCATDPAELDPAPPAPLPLRRIPAAPDGPTRGVDGAALLAPGRLRTRTVDPRFGPVDRVVREALPPYAMSVASLPDSLAMGFARAGTFADAEPVAILEAYERLGGFPHEAAVVGAVSYREVADHAVDPDTLGQYTAEQLAHPGSRVTPYTPDTPMDWVWARDLHGGPSLLVPAEIGFYQYDHRFRRAYDTVRRTDSRQRTFHFHDSSSGCALGSTPEEAALHSLFELAERDAFLNAWHRATPLPTIELSSVKDPAARRLLDLIDARGFDVHLLVATDDIDLPVIWSLAVNRERPFPASFSAAGSGPDPVTVARTSLWELAQLVTDPVTWTREDIEPMFADPWLVDQLHDHLKLYSLPEALPRVTSVLGGPPVALHHAFPTWPHRLRDAARGDVRRALDFTAGLFADAGLERVLTVDQSTREHRDLGLAVAKAVVPGITPMCFGQPQQRLTGLPRLAAALAGTPAENRTAPYDPHPFP
ncbi:TOMM precursor leader peptide-binding protein [Streptomyces brevispora]|uniref:TOMM precursor leader peptide-binding protein n=1 Tax=Streptomyces brevispora TaxID=887462 RepID=UPI002E3515EA|nr:TOMM precursor leader peptide-binding protein [Streptomyces brevispora]